MNRLILLSYNASKEEHKEEYLKDIFHKSIHLNDELLSKSSIEYCIETYNLTTEDLIFVHSSIDLEIKGYKIIYFSLGCKKCGEKKINGNILKEIISLERYSHNSVSDRRDYQKRLWNCYSKNKKSKENDEEMLFLKEAKPFNFPKNCHLYLSENLKLNPQITTFFQELKEPSTKEEILALTQEEEFTYIVVPFAGYGNPQITTRNIDIEAIDLYYNHYFLELKELQVESQYKIIYLFLSYNEYYVPNFFKKIEEETTKLQKNINQVFLSPIKKFNRDNHLKFLFAEILYRKEDKEPLNFITFETKFDIEKLNIYLQRDIPYRQLKEIYYKSIFFNKEYLTLEKIEKYKEYWRLHKELKYNDSTKKSEGVFHDLDIADMRTNMPFYFPAMLNKLHLIKKTFKNQTLDFLLIDDQVTLKEKAIEIEQILSTIFLNNNQGQELYKLTSKKFDKNNFSEKHRTELIRFNQEEQNIRNTNFILVDFLLDPDRIFFGSDFIERVEKQKKKDDEEFRSWYFITSYLSGYVNKFEIDKIMYEYYDSATVQIGDSTHENFRIFFIKKLIYFIYSKVNIYIRINNITQILIKKKKTDLIKKLIGLMQSLLQQVDLLELRYSEKNRESAEQFYTLTLTILEDYRHKIYYQWEIKEIKFQQLKALKDRLSPTTNVEIRHLYRLIKSLSFDRGIK